MHAFQTSSSAYTDRWRWREQWQRWYGQAQPKGTDEEHVCPQLSIGQHVRLCEQPRRALHYLAQRRTGKAGTHSHLSRKVSPTPVDAHPSAIGSSEAHNSHAVRPCCNCAGTRAASSTVAPFSIPQKRPSIMTASKRPRWLCQAQSQRESHSKNDTRHVGTHA
jgi:hypothetical protein